MLWQNPIVTKYRHDDYDKIKDVPRLFEVVQAKAKDFDETFKRKDGNENRVEVCQSVSEILRLLVVLNGHADHIRDDDQHHADLEFLSTDQIEEK